LAEALALDGEQRRDFEAAAKRAGLARRGGASGAAGPWIESGGSALPFALTSFVGRETELEEIATLVRQHRLVTLTGSGGVGKTQTALQVGNALGDTTEGAVCFVGLAPIGDPSLVVAAIASALGVQEVLNHPLLETLLAYLKNKKLLLILDNCEHVIAQAAIVAGALLAACPNLRILATSREPLRAAGENAYRLSSLSVPSPEAARRLGTVGAAAYGAIVLFADRARAVDHRFTLTDENAPIVAEICRRLDGIPLAIELAAARVTLLSVKAIAKKLDDRFRILTGGDRTALLRHQTMRAAIDWSYDLLDAPEQRVFQRLSVFAGGSTLATAAAVCSDEETAQDEVFELLSSLVDKSLVVVDLGRSEPRYSLLESFEQYACEKLATRADRDIVAHRHALAHLDLAEQLDRVFYYDQEAFRALAHEEMDNWRTALQWALTDRGDVLLGQRLIGVMRSEWLSFAPLEGQRWLVAALELIDERTPTSVLASLDYVEASIASALSKDEVQLASSGSAIARYRVLGDSLGIALAESLEAQVLLNFGRVAEARSVLAEASRLAGNVGNRWLAGYVLRLFAYAGTLEGDLDAARSYIVEAQQNYEAVAAKADVAWTMEALGAIEFLAGNTERALRHATDALAIFRALKRVRGIAWMLHHIIDYHVSLGDYAEAEKSAREGLDLAREHNLDVVAAYALQNLGVVAALRPQREAERSLEVYVRVARIYGFVDARLTAMGSARRWIDNPEQEPYYHRALAVLRDALGDDTVAKLVAEGAAITEEQAVEEALTL
jgi:predicted ATPase